MASNTIVISNGTGQQVLDQLNAIFPAISSMQYGSTDPYVGSYAVAGMWWVDTGNNLVKQRNSANTAWLTQGSFDATTGAITWNNANIATTLQTARTIGVSGVTGTAQSFDGSSNITIPITKVPATLLTGTASISTTGNAAKDGNGNVITDTYATQTALTNAINNIQVFTGATSSTAGTSGLVPQPASGDNNNFLCGDGTFKAISGFLGDSGHSFSTNGYQKLSNGLIIQWINASASSSGSTVTYPISFPNAVLLYIGFSNSDGYRVQFNTVGLSSSYIHSANASGNYSDDPYVKILLIGY